MHTFVLDGDMIKSTSDWGELAEWRERGCQFWLDLDVEPTKEATELLTKLGLHELTQEDIWGERTLPNVEDFGDYISILVHGVERKQEDKLELSEIDIILGKNYVITHAHRDTASIGAVKADVLRTGRCMKRGPVWIVHAVLDHLVDHYTPILDQYDAALDKLEEDIIAHAGTKKGRKLIYRIFAMKREIQQLRRIASFQHGILLRLSRAEFDEVTKEAVPFFRDVYDHFTRVTDMAEGYRERATSAMEAYLSVQSNRMNEIMKTLTLLSTVMLPLTFLAGVYGMNFDFMPELHWRLGYPIALVMMLGVALGIVQFFRHRQWI